LKNVDKKKFDVVVVSPRNHFLFTPLLNSTTVGTLEFRSIIEPVRNIRFREDSHFQLAKATKLDADKNTLTCSSDVGDHSYELKYDFLVIGVGALSNTFGIPGVSEHAYFLKEIADARAVRNRIITNFEESLYPDITQDEQKRLLHFVIVGGGPTGVEFGAELYDFITEDVTRLFSQEKNLVRVTLIEANEILPSFDRKLRTFAERKFKQRKNYEVLKSRVVEVGRDYVKVEDGTKLPCGMVLWSTGLAPRSFIDSLAYPKSKSKQLIVNSHLQVKGISKGNVFAIGDCSYIEANPLPCTGQVAEREGRYLAKALESHADGETGHNIKPFSLSSLGMLAYIGEYDALADLPFKGGKLTGFKTWFLWRSAYLTRLGSWRLRMQVPFDWTRTFLFGRDTSKF